MAELGFIIGFAIFFALSYRPVRKAILLLFVIAIVGYKLALAVAVASFAVGIAWGILEARAGEPAR